MPKLLKVARKTSSSPYARYKKTPYRYSDLYNRWHSAAKRRDEHEMFRAAQAHDVFLRGLGVK